MSPKEPSRNEPDVRRIEMGYEVIEKLVFEPKANSGENIYSIPDRLIEKIKSFGQHYGFEVMFGKDNSSVVLLRHEGYQAKEDDEWVTFEEELAEIQDASNAKYQCLLKIQIEGPEPDSGEDSQVEVFRAELAHEISERKKAAQKASRIEPSTPVSRPEPFVLDLNPNALQETKKLSALSPESLLLLVKCLVQGVRKELIADVFNAQFPGKHIYTADDFQVDPTFRDELTSRFEEYLSNCDLNEAYLRTSYDFLDHCQDDEEGGVNSLVGRNLRLILEKTDLSALTEHFGNRIEALDPPKA